MASTISNMVDFGGDTNAALIALCAALFSIVVYSVGASLLGIPTSESHSLIAGLSGAAIAIQGGIGGINMGEWVKVLYGLVASLAVRLRRRLVGMQGRDPDLRWHGPPPHQRVLHATRRSWARRP